MRAQVRSALAEGPLSRSALAEHVTRVPAFAHLGDAFTHPSWTFIKPFAWQGDLRLGPTIDGEATVQSFDGVAAWVGTSPLAEAGPRAVRDFLGAYAPATEKQLHAWFTAGLTVRWRLVREWLDELGSVTAVTVAGERAYVRTEDAASLAAATPSETVVLLPAYDPWAFAGGTDFTPIVPASHRALISRGGRPVVAGGAVRGVWRFDGESVDVEFFGHVQEPGRKEVDAGVARLSQVLQRELNWRATTT
ncbi:DNA glycosylase AlkZ-like family protein [Microbacterium binotii]|uniref:DNA glycosylase AlkZ-like family protein n=1 Tax=Microbacterium binotii TaxID=462710 RepID=UPI0031DC83ED